MNAGQILLSSLIGYLLGCIQTAYILGKIVAKIDIRKHGSNNAGASNATILLGWKYGVITALVDIFKGTLAVIIVSALFKGHPDLMMIAGTFAILGHNYPFYLNFKGGKGTASILGVLLGIDFRIALLAAAALVILTVITDYIAIGTIGMYIVTVAFFILKGSTPVTIGLIIFLAALGTLKHAVNIKRIIKREETGLRSTFRKKS